MAVLPGKQRPGIGLTLAWVLAHRLGLPGLVYGIAVSEAGQVHVQMTLTSPGCPAGTEIIDDVNRVVRDLDGVAGVDVELVWDPYWTPEKMDPRVRAFLGF